MQQRYSRTGDPDFVEVIIREEVPTFFMRVIERDSVVVRARAVGGLLNYADGCVIALNPSASAALNVPRTADLYADCAITVNSQHGSALRRTGTSDLVAAEIGVTGGYSSNGSGNLSPEPVIQMPPVLDPFAHIDAPDPSDSVSYPLRATNLNISSTPANPLEPGLYAPASKGGLQITGSEEEPFRWWRQAAGHRSLNSRWYFFR